jgi:hypothetical protein
MAIEIVDLPMNNMVIFHSYVSLPEGIQEADNCFIPWNLQPTSSNKGGFNRMDS